jgi:hypothetical protein
MIKTLETGNIDIIYWESNSLLSNEKKQKILTDLEWYGYQNFEFDEALGKILPYKNSENCLSIHTSRCTEVLQRIGTI